MTSPAKAALAQFLAGALEARQHRVRRSKIPLALFGISSVLILIGVVFFSISLTGWLSTIYSPHKAYAVGGAVLLGLAALAGMAGVAGWNAQAQRRRKEEAEGESHDPAEILMETLTETLKDMDLEKPIQENPKTAALLAAVAGFIVADKFI